MSSAGSFVIDSAAMQRIAGQLGSNPAGVYQDSCGQRYYIKTLDSAAHVRNEFVAAKLYQLCGAPTLTYRLCKAPDQIATKWLQLDKKCVKHLSECERKQAQRWLGVHAWMANWDAAGFTGDNQGVADGKVLTLDVGGALNFRAQGDPKGKAFATSVGELNMLRTDPDNPHAVKLFADMNAEEIRQAIRVVVQIPDQQIRCVISDNGGHRKLAEKMLARKANMTEYLTDILPQLKD